MKIECDYLVCRELLTLFSESACRRGSARIEMVTDPSNLYEGWD